MQGTLVAGVRRFNRTVTQRVGALNDAYLSRSRPLGQARVLWEIGEAGPEGCEVRALRSRLDLDSGYVSRLLRALEADGLIEVEADDGDGRVRTARLTEVGRTEREHLDRASDELAEEILGPLNDKQRKRLVTAMADVERLLTASQVEIAVTDPRLPMARHCLDTYFEELAERFEAGFDPTQGISANEADLTMPAGMLLVATLHGEPVGCGALKLDRAGGVAHIKRMWVDKSVRGLGLGRRLLAELEAQAVGQKARVLRLDTNRVLTEAVAMYRAAGFDEVERFNDETYAHHWFEKVL